MQLLLSLYKPVEFFFGSLFITALMHFTAAYISYYQPSLSFLLFPLILGGMSSPSIMAFLMLIKNKNKAVWNDFCQRLLIGRVRKRDIPLIVLFWPCLILLAITVSLLFGCSANQFLPIQGSLDQALGSNLLVVFIIVFLSCSLEEIGWRGYGIDSLNNKYNVWYTSLIFATIWSLWHIPAFFIKDGYFQQALWNVGFIQVITYFTSLFPITLLMNWAYIKNNRSILIVILSHAVMNISYGFFQIQPFTKIIIMLLLLVVAGIVVVKDKKIFFNTRK